MHRRRFAARTPLLLAASAFLMVAFAGVAARAAEESEEKSPIESIRVTTLDGKELRFDEKLAQGPVLLDFWATWCKPCKAALPEVQKLHGLRKPTLCRSGTLGTPGTMGDRWAPS